jgi:lysophospholipase L1-like esterase
MPAPNKASIDPEMLTARASPPVNAKTKDALARLRDAGVEIVDLFEVYDKAREVRGGPDYYLAQDSHWSPEGMRLAADALAGRLLETGWVEKGMVKYETKPVTVERYGDVLKMIRVPQVEKLYEPQRMNCTQVIDAATGQAYEDDPNSPVLVLGDSFLRIFERDEPGSGGFVAHLAHNLGFGVTSLVNDGGASTLVRQQLASRPALLAGKKVVVWEFVERDIRFGTEGWQVIRMR